MQDFSLFFLKNNCRFTIDVLQKIKKYTVTSICVIVEVLTKTHAKEETVYEYYNTNYEV